MNRIMELRGWKWAVPTPFKGYKACIRDLNPQLVCILCAGYFVDATTITECLHTFCKSCIVKYLQTSKYCPNCNTKVHETQPLLNLKADRTLQDIVYKVVPGLWENEMKRRRDFEKTRGLSQFDKEDLETDMSENVETAVSGNQHFYLNDELIHVCLEPCRNGFNVDGLKTLRKFVRCSKRAQVFHIKKLIKRIWPEISEREVEVIYCGYAMPENYCLKRISLLQGNDQNTPYHLQFFVKC